MKKIEFKTSKGEFIAVCLPEDHIVYEFAGKYFDLESGIEIGSSRDYRLVCRLPIMSEEDAKEVVDSHTNKVSRLETYTYEDSSVTFTNPIRCLTSLLQLKKADISNENWYLFKRIV